MKIIELRAENVMRLKAVEITPDGTMQVIGGRNAQGKSAVLNAIWLALGGGKASKDISRPIRDGEEKASVRLDLGDLVVTRSWTRKGTSLKVENADGAQYKSPQGMLDALVGQLSFDPLAFTRLSPKEQREALLDLVDVDIDAIDSEITGVYAERTSIGRQGKSIGDVEVDDDLPTEETSAADIIQQIRASQDLAVRNAAALSRRETISNEIEKMESELQRIQQKIVHAKNLYLKADTECQALVKPADVESLEAKLDELESFNQKIRANNTARERKADQDRLRQQYAALTDRLTELDEQKATALASAKFPVQGLSFDDSGVLYNGLPLSQASSAEQIRVSLAMGMALNPKLRVLMIKDGSLLDADSMEAIKDQIAEKGWQLWLERVGDADQGAVIIEDGQVA